MEKIFEMKKEHLEEWIDALENGKFRQGEGTLMEPTFYEDQRQEMLEKALTHSDIECYEFCCLGLYSYLLAQKTESDVLKIFYKLEGCDFPSAIEDPDLVRMMDPLILEKGKNAKRPENSPKNSTPSFALILTMLNDGARMITLQAMFDEYPELKETSLYKEIVAGQDLFGRIKPQPFSKIAQFIRETVEPV